MSSAGTDRAPARTSPPWWSLVGLLALVLVGGTACMVREVQSGPALDRRGRWVLLPLRNQTETPQAGERAEAILSTMLRSRGLADLAEYQDSSASPTLQESSTSPPGEAAGELPELDERKRAERAVAWARSKGYQYAIAGSVEEWRYRNGLDGEPAVGLTIRVVELPTGRVVWSASGAQAGWGRDTLAGTAQRVMRSLLSQLALK